MTARPDPAATEQAASAEAEARATPMMRQYLEVKAANPDCLLFYRMGDFYELFFDDAVAAAESLSIALTTRGKHLGEDIPMCGVPVHTADDYLQRLIARGHKVAVCEQLEDPAEAKKRGSKSVVRRDVVRLVTPGTLTEETLLEAGRNNFLAALARVRAEGEALALAWADISTGEFQVAETTPGDLGGLIARIEPGEILVSDSLYDDPDLRELWRSRPRTVSPLPDANFDSTAATRRIREFYGVATLDGFGGLGRAETAAVGAIVAYVERTQRGSRPPLSTPRRERRGAVMAIDAATRTNLEVLVTLSGQRRGSLAAAIDRTVTAGGARELARRVAAPLTDLSEIESRHDAVAEIVGDVALRAELRELLRAAPDMARARSRLSLGRGGPRDLAVIRDGITAAHGIARRLEGVGSPELTALSGEVAAPDAALADRLAAALIDSPPVNRRDGGFVRESYHAELDAARSLRDESRKVVASLQAKYQEFTGLRTLKVRHNNVLGYFVETTAANASKLSEPPFGETFFHRQTLANQVRFSTTELADLEGRIASAADRAAALEATVFDELVSAVDAEAGAIERAAAALGVLDVHAGFAALAVEQRYIRPEMSRDVAFAIEGGRHPIVEQALHSDGGVPFVANDCTLDPPEGSDEGRILLVTGPNMAGKSTYLRQNALIAVMAQAGSFVPAERARIGIVDRLFSRVGAADDLARGRSTFMVEMVETAAILNQAGPRSLVVLDEIGRGTATFDGLSIAWAAVEHLHEVNGCRALFATHFHELTALAESLPRLVNATVRVKEFKGEVIFLHEVVAGAADRSYGIQVAKLAGLPAAVVERAREVLDRLEAADARTGAAGLVDDLPLFSARPATAPATSAPPELSALADRLRALSPDDMSPRQALETLYDLRELLTESET